MNEKEYKRQWYLKNKERCLEKSKEWRENNREKRREIANNWVHRNMDRLVEEQRVKRQTLNGKSISVFSGIKYRLKHDPNYVNVELRIKRKDVLSLLSNWSGICPLCGEEGRPSIDRIDSDGHYEMNNLRVICLGCNQQGARIGRGADGRFVSAK